MTDQPLVPDEVLRTVLSERYECYDDDLHIDGMPKAVRPPEIARTALYWKQRAEQAHDAIRGLLGMPVGEYGHDLERKWRDRTEVKAARACLPESKCEPGSPA